MDKEDEKIIKKSAFDAVTIVIIIAFIVAISVCSVGIVLSVGW